MRHVYLGPPRLSGDLEPTVQRWKLPYQRHEGPAQVAAAAAAAMQRGEIIGWFQDRSEFGPRSLGARSILCHPGIAGMKDRLNQRVKFREGFRPFAGSVLAERADKWFDMPVGESPFMLLVCPVIAAQRHLVNEIVHVDGTCRMQTVGEDTPGPFRALIEAFEDQSGLPVVLNTSFNLRGMPIVEFPDQAIDCLYGSRLDRLFLGDYEITPPDLGGLVPVPCTTDARWSADKRSAGSAGTGRPVSELFQQILQRADGERSMVAVADDLGRDRDEVIDAALDMRRLGLLRWSGVPEAKRPVWPLAQYLPDSHA
jgi:carbamoyltransferase